MTKTNRRIFAFVLTLLALAQGAGAQTLSRGNQHAVTLWWVIFNDPARCTANPGGAVQCGNVDVFGAPFLQSVADGAPDPTLIAPNLDARPGVLFATGGVTTRKGRVRLVASLYRSAAGERLTLAPGADPMGLGRGLESAEAEIHLVVRDHGRPVFRDLLPQITQFLDPYCSDPNLLYFAGRNTCADEQFAVFGPDHSGAGDVFAFANPAEPVSGSRAHLVRDGDVITAVVETTLAR